ncbi:FXYD domain-containing ion transport regulator 4 isoform X1 [Lagenorhynchus albirostris]|uniref:FXYD domain-containing ion transport regulator 4 isoform X1 n=1 Tax=Lagenorhynchus albirostris TaxID=27610 RepID=UPI0028E72634|nr:FXYD domain-containing ion transport regulator 4 isoform X1 [Lagenorhynchus albirostris]
MEGVVRGLLLLLAGESVLPEVTLLSPTHPPTKAVKTRTASHKGGLMLNECVFISTVNLKRNIKEVTVQACPSWKPMTWLIKAVPSTMLLTRESCSTHHSRLCQYLLSTGPASRHFLHQLPYCPLPLGGLYPS